MEVKYTDNGKFAYYEGLKFTRDDKTGYYLNSTIRKRLHRYVYEKEVGEIPKGRHNHIHHIDGDKGNNRADNLELLTNQKHNVHHGNINLKMNPEFYEKFHKIGIEAAPEWHSSEEGIKWHKEHYERNVKGKILKEKEFTCEQCGENFIGKDNGQNRFCSNKCKSKWRRDSGVDDVERECSICGNTFITHKYGKTKTCSKECRAELFKQSRGWA